MWTMNVEFHYYTLHLLARAAGFSEPDSRLLAYASQYTDDALREFAVTTERGPYQSIATHHFGFWGSGRGTNTLLSFHFYPAGGLQPSPRRDGSTHPLAVAENAPAVRRLLVEALKSRDLYRAGIALHTFADSYAHQNFTGTSDSFNMTDTTSALPPVGHAQLLAAPDLPNQEWTDPRLTETERVVSNRSRYMRAAGKIYRYLCLFNSRSFADEAEVIMRAAHFYGRPGDGSSPEDRITDLVIDEHVELYRRSEWREEALSVVPAFKEEKISSIQDKVLWLASEVRRAVKVIPPVPVTARPGFFDSHFFRWNEAAKAQLESAQRIMGELGITPFGPEN